MIYLRCFQEETSIDRKESIVKDTGYTKFKAWLRENHVKVTDLAELLGLQVSTVSKKLNGYSDFTVEEIRTICLHYNISADNFFIAYKVS